MDSQAYERSASTIIEITWQLANNKGIEGYKFGIVG